MAKLHFFPTYFKKWLNYLLFRENDIAILHKCQLLFKEYWIQTFIILKYQEET